MFTKKKKKSGDSRLSIFLRKNLLRFYIAIVVIYVVYTLIARIALIIATDEQVVYMPVTLPLVLIVFGLLAIISFLMLLVRFWWGTGMIVTSGILYMLNVILLGSLLGMSPPRSTVYHEDIAYHLAPVNRGSRYDLELLKCDSLSIICDRLVTGDELDIWASTSNSMLVLGAETNLVVWLGNGDRIIYTYALE